MSPSILPKTYFHQEALPVPFIESLDLLDRDRILHAMKAPQKAAFWINPLLVGDSLSIESEPLPGFVGVRVVADHERDKLVHLPEAESGAIYPINPSSVIAVRSIEVQRDQEVLDLAAAPGGKTLMMAAAMENTGRIAAVEPIRNRYYRMQANMLRCGVTNTEYYRADGRSIGRKVPNRFDRVLLDAPCSTEARFRIDNPNTFAHWSVRKVKDMARKQRGLIRSGFRSLKQGGVMIYCTCSYSIQENESVVEYLLNREPRAKLEPIEIPGVSSREGKIEHTRRILPDDVFEGFFIAKISKLKQ